MQNYGSLLLAVDHIEADLHRELAELHGDIAELRQLLKSTLPTRANDQKQQTDS